MKKIKYTLLIIFSCAVLSCNEEEWLEETVYDFYSVSNSYTTPEQFNSAVAYLYKLVREAMVTSIHTGNVIFFYTSDIAYDTNGPTHELNSYKDKVTPEAPRIKTIWDRLYQIVSSANVIIGRIDDPDVVFPSQAERNSLKAEALFFRAYMYRCLGIQFGPVPLILEAVDKPKRDFVRAEQSAIWAQCIEDLIYASENLPDVSEQTDGRVTSGTANHLLAEMYLITKEWDKAIAAASAVIDNPGYALMTSRFGRLKDKEGDVYGDLFKRNNQNRSSGNTEGIWVSQYEYNVTGGGSLNLLTRYLVPIYWALTGDSDGVSLFVGSTVQNGGRGIGWMAASDYLLYDVWQSDPDDMRNSEYNIIRDLVADNPNSAYYGQKIVESGAIDNFPMPYLNAWTAIFAKSTPINDFPAEVIANPETGVTTSGGNGTFTDTYMMRLAETYLIRAEAYLGKGDQTSAAADINVVRARANATPVAPGDVDIDYILDERARELCFEEFRIYTLMRLGKLVERVRKYNPMANFKYNTEETIFDYHNVWPIPHSEIETNSEALLTQNPGYN